MLIIANVTPTSISYHQVEMKSLFFYLCIPITADFIYTSVSGATATPCGSHQNWERNNSSDFCKMVLMTVDY